MLMLSLVRAFAVLTPWMINLATWTVARSLNMPEPLVHSTGVLVFARVQAAETKAIKTLKPARLRRQLRSLFH